MFILGGRQWFYKERFWVCFLKEFAIGCGSAALLTVPYLNFDKSLIANEHALIFMSFLDYCKGN